MHILVVNSLKLFALCVASCDIKISTFHTTYLLEIQISIIIASLLNLTPNNLSMSRSKETRFLTYLQIYVSVFKNFMCLSM